MALEPRAGPLQPLKRTRRAVSLSQRPDEVRYGSISAAVAVHTRFSNTDFFPRACRGPDRLLFGPGSLANALEPIDNRSAPLLPIPVQGFTSDPPGSLLSRPNSLLVRVSRDDIRLSRRLPRWLFSLKAPVAGTIREVCQPGEAFIAVASRQIYC